MSRKKLFFLRQTGIVQGGLAHVEDHVETALLESSQLQTESFSIMAGLKTFQPCAVRSREDMLKAYGEYLLENVRSFGPDAILVLGGYAIEGLFPGLFRRMKETGLRVFAWHADDPYYFDLQKPLAPFFDRIFTVDQSVVKHWERLGVPCQYLPCACSPHVERALQNVNLTSYGCDICFIGTPFKGSKRVQLIDRNADFLAGFETRIFGSTKVDSWKANLTNHAVLGNGISDQFLDPSQANRYYLAARINLNIHKDSYGHCWDRNSANIRATSPNERFFFVAGLGGFQLVDDFRPDLFSLFPGDLVATFSNDASFRSRIAYFLKNETERKEKAAKLKELVLARHTYSHRIQTIIEAMESGRAEALRR